MSSYLTSQRFLRFAAVGFVTLAAAGCSSAHGGQSNKLTLYTCVTDTIEQAVIKAYKQKHPGVDVDVFRAPTGQLNARVAADVRGGGIKANVIWACDPLTMHGYDAQGLLRPWTASGAADLDPAYRTQHFVGVDLLYLVAVVHKGVTRPASWADLTKPEYRGGVALPSPKRMIRQLRSEYGSVPTAWSIPSWFCQSR